MSQNGEVLSRRRLGAHCEVIRSPRDPHRSREFHGPAVVQVEGETLWFARVFDALEHVGEATSHLARFGDDGSVERLDVGRPIRTVVAVAKSHAEWTATGCSRLVGDDGFIAIMSQDGRTLNVSRNPPGCSATFGCVGGHRLWCRHILLSVNEVGLLSAFGGPITDIARLWTQSLGGLSRGVISLKP